MAKLLTHHDPYHIHATCGLLSLLHFMYRFWLICLDENHAGFGDNLALDTISLVVLALPNVTSYVFTIVNVKKGSDGFSIWKEYRGHAFVYVTKLWIFLALLVYAQHFEFLKVTHNTEFLIRATLEFGTMLGLSYVTSCYPPQVSTIRGMYQSSLTVFIAGFLQFMARAAMLYGTPHERDMITACLLGMMIIQLNAFNMTLRKKRIIGPKTTQAFYSTLLASGLYLVLIRRLWQEPPASGAVLGDKRFQFIYLGIIAYACRRQGMDRFLSWIVALSAMELYKKQMLQ